MGISRSHRVLAILLAEHERELLTILFTDLVDSTQLQSELGNAEAARLVQIHRRLVREELEKHNSREVEWAGDSCLAVFSMPSDGVRFALTMQAAMRKARKDVANLPRVRVGLHLGEIFVHKQRRGAKKTEELFGLQVSEASRFLMIEAADAQEGVATFRVVTSWFDELELLVPTSR